MTSSVQFSFVAGALGLAVAAAGLQLAEASEATTFQGEKLWQDTAAFAVTGVLSKPNGDGPFPAVVLLPNCGGPKTAEFAKFWPVYLNKLGYVTLNVDHFTPRKNKNCTKRFKPNSKMVAQDAYGALTYLSGLSFVDKNRVAVLGSSLGALAINWFAGLGTSTANGLTFTAAVSLYPAHCKKVVPNGAMIPLLIILGDKEKGAATCRQLSQGPRLKVNMFANTYHGFDQPSATRLKNGRLRKDVAGNERLYSRPATEKAQALVKEFFAANLPARSASAGQENSGEAKLAKVGGKDPYMAVSRRDLDGDGKVSLAEWDKSPGVFSKIDADGDGFLTPQEFYDRWRRMP